MSYTVLDENMQVKGRLSLNNGRGNTTFFGDTITTQIATDNSNDPVGLTTSDYTNQDKQGNAKQWSHSVTLNVEATDLGTSIGTTDYILYFDSVADHYYEMKVISASTDRNSGFITVTAINTAIFELGKQLIQAEKTIPKVDLKGFVSEVYKNAPFSLVIADDSLKVIDYTISANTSLQALLQDLQTKYDVDVDSWVELDETGKIVDRILYFGHVGSDNGELIRYGGSGKKGFESIVATEVSDIIYTKLYVTGKTDDKDSSKGHIGSVNNGMEYIVDDDANQRVYAIGASQQQPAYLEGIITNNLLSEPSALLTWAKQQMSIFNHPRFNYTVTPLHDQVVSVGDTVTVQDFHIKPEILVTSKVIQKTVSFASPETNTFVLGEFSSIFTDNMNKNINAISLIKKDVTVVQAAADIAKAQADAAYQQAVTAQEKAIHAQTSADGKTTTYTVDSVQDLPQSANEGDIGWVKLSDGTHMYSYIDGKWVEKINPSMGADIDKKVSDVVTQAKDYSDKAIADNQVKIDASIKSVDDKANQLKQDQSALDTKAQGYANQALSDAKANTAQAVKDVTTNSQKALDQAKTDLTKGIAKEAADRQSAVNALDKTAQGYANQAKSDALNTIAKEVTDRQNAVSALDTKATNAVNQAKSDINDTINAISVGGRNLLLNSNDFAKTPNWSLGTEWNIGGELSKDTYQGLSVIQTNIAWGGPKYNNSALENQGVIQSVNDTFIMSAWVRNTGTTPQNIYFFDDIVTPTNYQVVTLVANSGWIRIKSQPFQFTKTSGLDGQMKFEPTTGSTGGNIQQVGLKLEKGNIATDWTPAPEDVDSATAKAQLTADQATTTINTYKTSNDGRVASAESKITQNANAITQKVSQTDYDKKTGDLTTAVNTAQSTANTAVTTIGNYQTSNDKRVKAAESAISQNANAITQKVSQTDYNQKTGELSGKISEVSQTAGKISQTVSDVKTQVDGLSVGGGVNLLQGTGTASGDVANGGGTLAKGAFNGYDAVKTNTAWSERYINLKSALGRTNAKAGDWYTISVYVKADKQINTGGIDVFRALGNSDAITNDGHLNSIQMSDKPITTQWQQYSWSFQINDISLQREITRIEHGNDTSDNWIYWAGWVLEKGIVAHDWSPAPKDTDNKISTVSQTVDSISSIVSDPTTGLTKRVQTAEGTLSQVTGADIPNLQKATYWQPYSSLNFNDYTKQGSFFFNTTSAKTNGPVSGNNSWTYLMVEQGTSDNGRIKQTAWYDGVAGVKITYVRTLNSGTWSPWYANDNDSVTTIAQTNEGIRTEISNRQTGDINTLSQAKDFTSSQISNSESNMRSLINQKADSVTVGVIQNDIKTLKSNTQWERFERFDDMNGLTRSGRFFIGASAGTNSAVTASFYIMVDAPQPDRITQTQWKDLDGSLMYRRTYNGSSWTPWTQMVMSSTLLNIFHDSWSLGTSTNDGITKQMVTGIMGQPDGTLILKGNSLILDGNTTVTGDFYAKGGNFQNINASNITFGEMNGYKVNITNVNVNNLVGDTISGFNFNVNKQMTIASGGIIKSDVVNMGSNSFYVNSSNIDSSRISSEGYKVSTFRGNFNISSSQGSVYSSGDISVYNSGQSQPYKNGHYGSEYNGNNILLYATGYDNSDPNEFLNISSAQIDISHSSDGLLSNATDKTRIRSNLIETTGTLNAFGVTQTPRVYSWPNLTLESIQQSVVLKAGNQNILQVRENSYVYLLTRHSGSGGSSLQIAGDGALFVQSSASKYKEDIQYDGGTSVGDKFLTLDPATWQDKDEYEQRKLYRETGIEPTHQIHMTDKRYYGLIAEDLVKAGLEEFVVRDEVTGEVNGLEYDKVAISLIPVVREQRDAINELRLEVERLKQK